MDRRRFGTQMVGSFTAGWFTEGRLLGAREVRLRYGVWDVFTSQPLTGNPLAVVWLPKPLPDAQMLQITREFSHSETCFVEAASGKRPLQVRIFTAVEELPFAGHPVLGVAFALHRLRPQRVVEVPLRRGPTRVEFGPMPQGEGLMGQMLQGDAEFGPVHRPEAIAPLVGLPVEELDGSLPVQSVSTGLWRILVPVKSLAAIRKVTMDHRAIAAYCQASRQERGIYLVTRETEAAGTLAHARYISPRVEDSATGSAVGCAIAWLVRHGAAEAGKLHWVEQGAEVKRPSRLAVQAEAEGRGVRVGGQAVLVQQGEICLP